MIKIILAISTILFLNSCSTTEEQKFVDQVSPDLTTVFNLNSDKFDKFKVEELTKKDLVKTKTLNDKQTSKIEFKKNAKIKYKKESKKKNLKLKNNRKKVIVKKIESKQKEIKLIGELPDDYPKSFVLYDKKSKKVWSKFNPHFFPGEKFVIALSYLGVTAGHIKIETKKMVKLNNDETYHFIAKLKSATFYKYIYSLDDTVESFISKDQFLPVKYTLAQRESGQIVDDLQLFDHEKHKTFFWYKRLKKGKTKTRHVEAFIPNFFQDSFSSLFFVRGLPLKTGDIYQFPVMTRGKTWLIKMKVAAKESISIMGKKVLAIRVNAETHFPGVLKKKGDIIFWYSADIERRLLKFQANVKIGAIKGELVDYTAGNTNSVK